MSDASIVETPLQFGSSGSLFGILTKPAAMGARASKRPVFVFLSAGLIHRAGPFRLYVHLARTLASAGFPSLRIDLSGIGDSERRPGIEYTESVAADFADVVAALATELGDISIVLAGLCSGADNAIRLSADDDRIAGLVLLDPVCERDDGFDDRARQLATQTFGRKLLSADKYLSWLKRRIPGSAEFASLAEEEVDYLSLRNVPSTDSTRSSFLQIRDRGGHVLCVFSRYAEEYYNGVGQLNSVLRLPDGPDFCEEVHWPHVEHSYQFVDHRNQLISSVRSWASRHFSRDAESK